MTLLLCMRTLHAKTGTILVDMTWKEQCCQIYSQSQLSWKVDHHEAIQLWNNTAGARLLV